MTVIENQACVQVDLEALRARYHSVRSKTRSLVETLSAEDQMVQSFADASPTKWHQAHTTWFFETFILRPFLEGYRPIRDDFRSLFNSYYLSLGEKIPEKRLRSSFSRPSLEEVLDYRLHVDREMHRLLSDPPEEVIRLIVLGLNHEQQHQELALTDIKHEFFSNPLHPAYRLEALPTLGTAPPQLRWRECKGGMVGIGCTSTIDSPLDFCFDNETPRHAVYLQPFHMASRAVTCREYLNFIADDGYARPDLWLSDGWDASNRNNWEAPRYWERDSTDSTGWRVFTLRGWHGVSGLLDTPVCHVSFYEADAFAKWCSARLPTEAEWEWIASEQHVDGNLLDTERFHPASADGTEEVEQLYGDCWEWTASAYSGYPGYRPHRGALGEYNAKFMSSQMILRGGSCVTPKDHIRPTYRNFFSPATRWHSVEYV
jgi:ergothioneine biosynthesis protein EgtB